MDVIVFAGQSNMVGVTECFPDNNSPVKGAFEYKYLSDSLVPLVHPVGENIDEIIQGSSEERGSLVPAFCRAYTESTGREVVAIHTARGGSTLSTWLPGMPIFRVAKNKITAGIKRVKEEYTVERIYFVWLQGESDALCQNTEQEYTARICYLKNVLKSVIDIDKFCLIRVGYFAKTASWAKGDPEEKMKWDETIMGAQDNLALIDSDFLMLTGICKELSIDPSNFTPYNIGHYNNASLDIIGREAGKALADFAR